MSPLDFLVWSQHHTRQRFVLSLFTVNLLWTYVSLSQRSYSSFGPCVERSIGYSPTGLTVIPASINARAEIAVLASEPPGIDLFTVTNSGAISATGAIPMPRPQRSITAIDLEKSGTQEYVSLSTGGGEISILKKWMGTYRQTIVPTNVRAQRLVIADINNDGRQDILLFGKTMTGVATLLGTREGTFAPGPLLFQEISVADLYTTDLNGDGITDVLLLNWLSNQMVVLFGISRGVFSEQLSVDLPTEPGDIAVTRVSKQRTFRVAVTLPDERKIALIRGNSAGEFNKDGTITCPGRPFGVQFVDVNNDGLPDIVSSTDKGFIVARATSAGEYDQPAVFGIGNARRSWCVADVDGDARGDLVLIDYRMRRIVVAGNSEYSGRITWPDCYAVGDSPRAIAIRDFNGDGSNDLAVVNMHSSTLSLLMNKGGGAMHGQRSVSIPERPEYVVTAAGDATTLLTTHPTADKIAVVHLVPAVERSITYAMPTGKNPHVLLGNIDSVSHTLQILVRYEVPRAGSVSLSLFEQLSGRRFLERSLQPDLPTRISALTALDFSGRDYLDLIFAVANRVSKQTTVAMARGGPGFTFLPARPLFAFGDTLSVTKMILAGNIDVDDRKDIMLVMAPPRNQIGIALGSGDGTFSDSLQWLPDIQPLNEDGVLMKDIDGDGKTDIAVLDAGRNAIMVLFGNGKGGFSLPIPVCSAEGVSAIQFASLRTPGVQDLVYTNADKGTVSIMFGPFHR